MKFGLNYCFLIVDRSGLVVGMLWWDWLGWFCIWNNKNSVLVISFYKYDIFLLMWNFLCDMLSC